MAESPQSTEQVTPSTARDEADAMFKQAYEDLKELAVLPGEPEYEATFITALQALTKGLVDVDLETVPLNKPMIDSLISAIDQQISAQVNEILHLPEFQKLESSWRSLWYLVNHTEFRAGMDIQIINASKEDLLNDFQDCGDWQKSGLFKTVYQSQYNTFGGTPYGLMVGNYEFDYRGPDIDLLKELARVSAVAKCPFIASVAPAMLKRDMHDFADLAKLPEMYEIFEGPMYAKWKSFRASDDARYVGLALPRFLLRAPYTIENQDVKEFVFEEDVRVDDHSRYLWGNAAFALAGRMAQSFETHGWYNAMVGPTSGGTVPDLPIHTYEALGQRCVKIPTETLISEDIDKDLCNFGFIPLVMRRDSDNAAFFEAPSCKSVGTFPDTTQGKKDETNARLGMSFPYLMIQCRLAHYLKVIWRENIGRIMDSQKMLGEITEWISQYCRTGTLDDELAARYPLEQVTVGVEPVEGKPGVYRAAIKMKPHFRLTDVTMELSMVGQLDPSP